VLEGLITSKTRIKMLLKFFTNSTATAYLRGLAEEFDESTNSIRHELNNLSKAGYLVSNENGRTIEYRANPQHPLYQEVRGLVHKYLGIDQIIENIVQKLGDLKAAYIIGDYAKGKDNGTIELVLVGEIDEEYLQNLVKKAKALIHRDIKTIHLKAAEFQESNFKEALLLWTCD
jgi:DeoR/GlpR family transcriptional regulator of sugar metabolism